MNFIKGLGAVILVVAIFLGLVSLMLSVVYGFGYLIGYIFTLFFGYGLIFGITYSQFFGLVFLSSVILALPTAALLNSKCDKIEKLLNTNNNKMITEIKTMFKEYRGY